jgi:hypothetical protein
MLNTYVKNRGETKSIIHENNHNKVSQVKWDAEYDGHDGNVSLDILDNNKKKHINLKFDNHDLEQIFNVPSENTSLDRRLLRDFGMTHAHNKKKINGPMVIELIQPNDTEDDIFTEPLLFTNDNSNSTPLNNLLEIPSHSNISHKKTKRRRLSQNSRARGKQQIIIPLTITSRARGPIALRRKTKYVRHKKSKGKKLSRQRQGKTRIISKNITIRI